MRKIIVNTKQFVALFMRMTKDENKKSFRLITLVGQLTFKMKFSLRCIRPISDSKTLSYVSLTVSWRKLARNSKFGQVMTHEVGPLQKRQYFDQNGRSSFSDHGDRNLCTSIYFQRVLLR